MIPSLDSYKDRRKVRTSASSGSSRMEADEEALSKFDVT